VAHSLTHTHCHSPTPKQQIKIRISNINTSIVIIIMITTISSNKNRNHHHCGKTVKERKLRSSFMRSKIKAIGPDQVSPDSRKHHNVIFTTITGQQCLGKWGGGIKQLTPDQLAINEVAFAHTGEEGRGRNGEYHQASP